MNLRIRHPRTFWIGMPLLLAALVAVHLEHVQRAARVRAEAAAGAVVVRAETAASGHTAIGVAEDGAAAGALTFAQLGRWDYRTGAPAPCPPEIQAHHGRAGELTGFMYPLAQGDRVRVFCLLRNTQTCCFGPRPQFNQYVFVETREPVPFERLRPVRVSGRFQVDPQPGQGYIYRFEDATVLAAGTDSGPVDAQAYAREHHLACWSWDALAGLAAQDRAHAVLPPELRRLEGVQVVVAGCVQQIEAGPPAQFVCSAHPPSGRTGGKAPTIFDAMTVLPAAGAALPEAWQEQAVWQGEVHLASDAKTWDDNGIVLLVEARACRADGAVAVDRGPLLPIAIQAVLVGGFLIFTLGWRRRAEPAGGDHA